MIYINRKGDGYLETVDEFDKNQRKEARRVCNEYNLSDPAGYYYTSQRCTADWKDSE